MKFIISFLFLLVSIAISRQGYQLFGSALINQNFQAEILKKSIENTRSVETYDLIQKGIINGKVILPKFINNSTKLPYELLNTEKFNANLRRILRSNNFNEKLDFNFPKTNITYINQKISLFDKLNNFDYSLGIVVLLDGNLFIDENFEIKYITTINSDYSFQIENVQEGDYYPFAIFDLNRDGNYDIQKDLILFYDPDNDNIPNSINVSSKILDDLKISGKFLSNSFTVRERLDTAKAVAKSIANDAKLLNISTGEGPNFIIPDTTYDGKVLFAVYQFYSSIQNLSIDIIVSPFGINFFTNQDTLDYFVEVPSIFLDSDSIFAICENNGGSSFRRKIPDAILFYEIGKVIEPPVGIDTTQVYWSVGYTNQDFSEGLFFIINPLTGLILYKSEFSLNPITAKEKVDLADSLAQGYASDAKLTYIILVDYGFEFLSEDTIDGKGIFLSFGYKSPTKDKFSVNYLLGNIVIDSTGWLLPFDIYKPLTEINLYLDSPTISNLAEINGGYAFRTDSVNVLNSIAHYLGQSPFLAGPIDTSQIYWIADYSGTKFDDNITTQKELLLFFNPINGTFIGNIILTNITKDEFVTAPSKFKLHQNYPNPFNPKTTISYELPERSRVKITIHNLIGQEIVTLIDKEQDSGKYYISFDASKLPSGVYFYRIEAGKFVEVKKMTLLK